MTYPTHAQKGKITSIKQRLKNYADKNGLTFAEVLIKFAAERLLARLSKSHYKDRFVLKGAMLFAIWAPNMNRPTRDMDFLGFGPCDMDEVRGIFANIMNAPQPGNEDDCLLFDSKTLKVAPITANMRYGGIQLTFCAMLDRTKISMHIDIGYGDAVTPSPELVPFPNILSDFKSPVIKAYPIYTAAAEKFAAMVAHGELNSRMKDFFDLWHMLMTFNLQAHDLQTAIQRTFQAKKLELPVTTPVAFTPAFVTPQRITMWRSFLTRNRLAEPEGSLENLIATLDKKLSPIVGYKK